MSSLSYPAIKLQKSNNKRTFYLICFLYAVLVVFIAPQSCLFKMSEAFFLCLLSVVYLYRASKDSHTIIICHQQSEWHVWIGQKQYHYDKVVVLARLNWLLILRFESAKRNWLLPVFSDQLSKEAYHYLCLSTQI